jgi:hypothetical protein
VLSLLGQSFVIAQTIEELGSYDARGDEVMDIAVRQDIAYLASGNLGLDIVDISTPSFPTRLATHLAFGFTRGIELFGDYAYLGSGYPNGMAVYNVSVPTNPLYENFLEIPANRDFRIIGSRLYTLDSQTGLTIYSLTEPLAPQLMGSVYIQDCQSFDVGGNYVYVASRQEDLVIVDISNPNTPIRIGGIDVDSAANSICLKDSLVFIGYARGGMDIVSIANPAQPRLIGEFHHRVYPNCIQIDGNYAFLTDRSNGVYLVDVSTPSSPLLLDTLSTQKSGKTVVYGENYFVTKADDGMQIYRIMGPSTGFLQGHFVDITTQRPIWGVQTEIRPGYTGAYSDTDGYFLYDSILTFMYNLYCHHYDYYDTLVTNIIIEPNQTTSLNIELRRRSENDVGVIAIQDPPRIVSQGGCYRPLVQATNYGTQTQTFGIVFEVFTSEANVLVYRDTAHISGLPRNSDDTVRFDRYLSAEPNTDYKLNAYTILGTDNNSANDSLTALAFKSSGDEIIVRYGTPDCSPILIVMNGESYATDIHLCLGASDQCFDSLLSNSRGHYYSIFEQWDTSSFLESDNSPPNSPGWSSQSFFGISDFGGTPNPGLRLDTLTKMLTYVFHVLDDSSLIGDTIQCLGKGISSSLGGSYAGDSLGSAGYPVREIFCPVIFVDSITSSCYYISGDINSDGQIVGSDVTYGVRYFKGLGGVPPDSCNNDSIGTPNHYLYVAADVNADCLFRGSDITRLVSYFKGSAVLQSCRFFPPPPLR